MKKLFCSFIIGVLIFCLGCIDKANNLDNKEIMVITQGHDFTVEGEIVDFSFKND